MIHDIKLPDNEADTVINLVIAGNDLVRVTNFISTELYKLKKESQIGSEGWYGELDAINRQIQEALSTQRCEASRRKYGL